MARGLPLFQKNTVAVAEVVSHTVSLVMAWQDHPGFGSGFGPPLLTYERR